MKLDVAINPVYLPHMQQKQFTQIYFGGSSSGKSFFLCQKIVLDNLSGVNWLCCRNVGRTIHNSIFNEITKAISRMGVDAYYSINNTSMTITCKLNDKQILFYGLDDAEKIKSITPKSGVLERIFIEEATEVQYGAYKQLTKRLRGQSEHNKYIILAFNPILKTHWIYREFFGKWRDDSNIYADDRLFILKTTYRDNMFLTAEDIALLESETDPYYRSVYTDGNWGVLGNVIFTKWRVENLSGMIPSFDKIYNGCDFGFANDPNALIKVHFDKKRRRIYVFNEVYSAGMSDSVLLDTCRKFCNKQYLICDCEDAKTIAFLADNGVLAVPCIKGADSVLRGIRFLMDYEIIIDVHCQHFKNEIEQYHWQEDKYGNVIARPADGNDHLIDALRYALTNEINSASVRAGTRIK